MMRYFNRWLLKDLIFHSQLEEQLGLRDLTEKQFAIGLYLIGCIDEDGYIRRDFGFNS